jgi:tetratricopeptide (TPR) repeat protein
MTLHRRAFLQVSGLLLLAPSAWAGRGERDSGRNFTGENPLGVSRAEFQAAQEGMELVYQRRYMLALETFEAAADDFPDSPLGPVGRAIVWQAWMFEDYDFRFDDQYKREYADATDRFKRAVRKGELRNWNWFLEAVHTGIHAMYAIRSGEYIAAFNEAWDALELVKKINRAVPAFVDLELALGLYNYWRSALTDQIEGLPSFGDHREEGLAQMKKAKKEGLLAPPPASLCLSYSYMEGERWDEAIAEGLWARKRYPDNVLNEMTLARVYRGAEKFDEALAALANVKRISPENKRLAWQIGETHYKSRRNNQAAREAFQAYFDSKPSPEFQAHALYRLGLIASRERKDAEALAFLDRAAEVYPKFKRSAKKAKEIREAKNKRGSAEPRDED